MPASPPPGGFESRILRTLYDPLLEDAKAEVLFAIKVADLAEQGHSRDEIARMTGASPAALRAAWARLDRAADRLQLTIGEHADARDAGGAQMRSSGSSSG